MEEEDACAQNTTEKDEQTLNGHITMGRGENRHTPRQKMLQTDKNGSCDRSPNHCPNLKRQTVKSLCNRDTHPRQVQIEMQQRQHLKPQHQKIELQQQQHQQRPPPLDGGWGYVLAAGAFFVALLLDGFEFSYGLLLPHVIATFDGHVAVASLCGGLLTGVILGLGPLAAVLIRKFGCRRISFLGGVVASLSIAMATQAQRIEIFVLFYGLFSGFGLGMVYLPSITMVNTYFQKKRGVVVGVVTSGSGIGLLVIAFLTDNLISEYGWRGCYLIISGIFLNLCVCACLMRPLEDNYRFGKKRRQLTEASFGGGTEDAVAETVYYDGGELFTKTESRNGGITEIKNEADLASYPLLRGRRASEDLKSSKDFHHCMNGNAKEFGEHMKVCLDSPERGKQTSRNQDSADSQTLVPVTSPNSPPDNLRWRLLQESHPHLNPHISGHHNKRYHQHHHHHLYNNNTAAASSLPDFDGVGPAVTPYQSRDLLNILPEFLGSFSTLRSDVTAHTGSMMSLRSRSNSLFNPGKTVAVGGAVGLSHVTLTHGCSGHTLTEGHGLEDEEVASEAALKIKEYRSCDLFKILPFDLFCVGAFLVQISAVIPTMFIPSYVVSHGHSASTAATVVSILGISNTCGRLMSGVLSYLGLGTVRVYNTGTFLAGLACFFLPLGTTFPALVAFALCHGFFLGFFPPLQSVILVELLGIERLPGSFGIMCVCKSIASVSGPFFAGALFEWARTYSVPFYLAGTTMMLSNIVHVVMSFCSKPLGV